MIIGIDPGVTRTGVVVLDGDTLLGAATFTAADREHKKNPTYHRIADLAEAVYEWLLDAIPDAYIGYHHLAIERPIYNKNPRAFEIQWRLYQQLCTMLADNGIVGWISEVHNGTAKATLTGNGSASKAEMLKHSPFEVFQFPAQEDREAVTDAYAIARSYEQGDPIYDADEDADSARLVADWGSS